MLVGFFILFSIEKRKLIVKYFLFLQKSKNVGNQKIMTLICA